MKNVNMPIPARPKTIALFLLVIVIFGDVFSNIFVGASVLVEVMTALLFRFNAPKIGFVAFVNVISQILMRVIFIFLPLPYLLSIILLEALVYSGEFFVYRKSKIMSGEKTVTLLIFTITANTLSLVTGLFLNDVAMHWWWF